MSKNNVLGIIFLLGMLAIFGCKKVTEPKQDLNICNVTEHQWYMDIIEGAAEGNLLDKSSAICRYTYQDAYYFEVENGLFSCVYCYIYDCDGNLAEFTNSAAAEDFIENRTDRVIIWTGEDAP